MHREYQINEDLLYVYLNSPKICQKSIMKEHKGLGYF